MGESKGLVRQYILDTNIFRYLTSSNVDAELNIATKLFWHKTKSEIENGEAVLLVPKEVIRELDVQSYKLKPKENEKIMKLLSLCRVVSPTVSDEDIEHQIRMLSSHVRSNFKHDIGRPMEYGGVSDSRILYTSYCEDAVLVTANTKDFLLYALLNPQNEECLYDIKGERYVEIPKAAYEKIHADPHFQELLQEFYRLYQESD